MNVLGNLRHVHVSDRFNSTSARLTRSSVPQLMRNARLVVTSALQHLADDPALLAIQVSRRAPFGARVSVGRVLQCSSKVFPAVGALGAVMAGRETQAVAGLEREKHQRPRGLSRLGAEVAILLDRPDLLSESAPVTSRARAAWSRGAITEALELLDDAGAQDSLYARRLRSESRLLESGFRLPVDRACGTASTPDPESREPLRVLHLLTNSLPHTQSGYSLRSHRILTSLRDQGVESLALTRTGYPVMVGLPAARDEDIVDGIRYVRTLPESLPVTQQERLESEVARALELVEEFRPHVLHATTNYLNGLVAQAVSDATGLPWIFEVRGLMEETWVASRRSEQARTVAARSERHRLTAAKEGELARGADAVVTLSRTMADELVRRGVERSKITLVPNGVELSLFEDHISPAQARDLVGLSDRHGYGDEAILVGAVSAIVDYEGFDILLRAAAVFREDERVPASLRERLRVVIAGDGAARPGLGALADELGISDLVHLPGRVPREQARRWVEALDVVVVPRRDVAVARAVTPQKPVEAMALGRPLIVSDLPALREVTQERTTGHAVAALVKPEDPVELATALRRMVVEPGGAPASPEELRHAARHRAWPELMRRYDEVYGRLAGREAGGDRDGS